uniref:Uncharacterized protein n=1 Tax=viral metagenome TaxID=1070528 RepID=A0A6M3JKL4_9ZZZZ
MWRPSKEWIKQRNIFLERNQPLAPHYRSRQRDYEAGADAILTYLLSSGLFTYGHHTPDIGLVDAPKESGYWVFIPADAKDEDR